MWYKISVILLLFFVFSFLFKSDQTLNQDLGRHLKLGELILQTGQVPKTNLFSYTNPDFPFINTHWLFEVFVYIFDQAFNLELLLVLKILIIVLAVFITIKIIPKEKNVLLLPLGFIFFHVLRERTDLRPEIFSFLFTSLTFFILEKYSKEKTRWIFILPLVQLIWINTHIYFFIGLLLQGIFLIHHIYQYLRFHPGGGRLKILAVVFVLSVLISLLNPNGLTGIIYPLSVSQNYGYTIVENQTLFFLEGIKFSDPNFPFVKLSWSIAILILTFAIIRKTINLKNALLILSGLVLSILNVRSFPYLVFLTLPALMDTLPKEGESIPKKRWRKLLGFFIGAVLILESYFYLSGDYYKFNDRSSRVGLSYSENIKGGVDFLLKNDLAGPIFNNFDIGSYIIYRGYPKYKVFVDGRPEGYPANFFSNIYIPSQSDYENFKKLDEVYDFKTIIFSHTDQTFWAINFLKNITRDQGWKVVYVDDFTVVLIKSENAREKGLSVINLNSLDPSGFKFDNHVSYIYLAYFLLNTDNKEAGIKFLQKTQNTFPQSTAINKALGKNENRFFW